VLSYALGKVFGQAGPVAIGSFALLHALRKFTRPQSLIVDHVAIVDACIERVLVKM